MQCPVCNRPMSIGHIAGSTMPRLIPGIPAGKSRRCTEADIRQLNLETDNEEWYLDIYYTGLAPWIPAQYCPDCKKVVCQLNILAPEYEEAKEEEIL